MNVSHINRTRFDGGRGTRFRTRRHFSFGTRPGLTRTRALGTAGHVVPHYVGHVDGPAPHAPFDDLPGAAGAAPGAIGKALGVSEMTIRKDLKTEELRTGSKLSPEMTTGLDGKSRLAVQAPVGVGAGARQPDRLLVKERS